jgi:hypothetical protein
MVGYENLIVSALFYLLILGMILAPFYYLGKIIKRIIKRQKLKGVIKDFPSKNIPPDDIENWNPEPDPIDVDPPEENPEDERLDK